jgi:hypothetical protein
MFARIKKNITE